MATSDFDLLMPFVFQWEGKTYEDDPDDPGGATKYGIDMRDLTAFSKTPMGGDFLESIKVALPITKASIKALTQGQAAAIYHERYWTPSKGLGLPRLTTFVHCDCSINAGIVRANKCLQDAVGVQSDGIVGPRTRAALKDKDDYYVALTCIDCRRRFYNRLCNSKPVMWKYYKGWMNRCSALASFIVKNR